MTEHEHSKACYTAGHIQHLAGKAFEAGAIAEAEKHAAILISQKLYNWLQSLPAHHAHELDFPSPTPDVSREQRLLEACEKALDEWKEKRRQEYRSVWHHRL